MDGQFVESNASIHLVWMFKGKKVGEMEMKEQLITDILLMINIMILIVRVRRLEKHIKQLEGR